MTLNWSKAKEQWNSWITDPSDKAKRERLTAGLAILTAVVAMLIWLSTPSQAPTTSRAARPSIDTFIPAGYTLVPIEIQNRESLDSVFGNHGIVDLYTSDQSGQPKKIANRIKMLRSPKNPQVFAVLTPDEQAPQIAGQPGPIFVTVSSMASTQPSKKNSSRSDKTRKASSKFKILEEG